MTTDTSKEKRKSKKSRAADGFVMMAMAVVTLALCMGLVSQVGLSFWLSVTVSAAFYMGLLSLHTLVRRHDQFDELRLEVERLTGEVARLNQTGGPVNRLPHAVNPIGPPGRVHGIAPPTQGAPVPHSAAPSHPAGPMAAPLDRVAAAMPPIAAKPQVEKVPPGEPGKDTVADAPPGQRPDARFRPEPKQLPPHIADEFGPDMPLGNATADPRDAAGHQLQKIVRAPQTPVSRPPHPMEGRGPDLGPPLGGFPPPAPPAIPTPMPEPGARFGGPPPARSTAHESGFDPRRPRATRFGPQGETGAQPDGANPAELSGKAPMPMPMSAPVPAPMPMTAAPSRPDNASTALSSEAEADATWSYRPGDEARQPGFSPSESDVEMIQGLIKKLADEVNSVDAQKLSQNRTRETSGDDALDRSVGALRQAARNMQEPLTATRGSRSVRQTPPLHATPESLVVSSDDKAAATKATAPAPMPMPANSKPSNAKSPAPATPAAPEAPATAAAPEFDVEALMRRAQPIATMTSVPPPLPTAPNVMARRAEHERSDMGSLDEDLDNAAEAESVADDIWNAVSTDAHDEEPPASNEVGERMARIADALAAGRVDVFLEPILDIEKQQARHYEVSVRLRDEDGAEISPDDTVEMERPSGILPLLDSLRLQRTAHVARRLDERNKKGSVFATFSGESLTADDFLATFAETYDAQAQLSGQLVLTFSQADARRFRMPQWTMINEMLGLGFGFALRAVTDLDMDFEMFAKAGFKFVKLDADVFLSGLPAPGALVPAADLCNHLEELGLTPIVEAIDDDAKREQVYAYGVRLGQGALFGGARQIKASSNSGAQTAAA